MSHRSSRPTRVHGRRTTTISEFLSSSTRFHATNDKSIQPISSGHDARPTTNATTMSPSTTTTTTTTSRNSPTGGICSSFPKSGDNATYSASETSGLYPCPVTTTAASTTASSKTSGDSAANTTDRSRSTGTAARGSRSTI